MTKGNWMRITWKSFETFDFLFSHMVFSKEIYFDTIVSEKINFFFSEKIYLDHYNFTNVKYTPTIAANSQGDDKRCSIQFKLYPNESIWIK